MEAASNMSDSGEKTAGTLGDVDMETAWNQTPTMWDSEQNTTMEGLLPPHHAQPLADVMANDTGGLNERLSASEEDPKDGLGEEDPEDSLGEKGSFFTEYEPESLEQRINRARALVIYRAYFGLQKRRLQELSDLTEEEREEALTLMGPKEIEFLNEISRLQALDELFQREKAPTPPGAETQFPLPVPQGSLYVGFQEVTPSAGNFYEQQGRLHYDPVLATMNRTLDPDDELQAVIPNLHPSPAPNNPQPQDEIPNAQHEQQPPSFGLTGMWDPFEEEWRSMWGFDKPLNPEDMVFDSEPEYDTDGRSSNKHNLIDASPRASSPKRAKLGENSTTGGPVTGKPSGEPQLSLRAQQEKEWNEKTDAWIEACRNVAGEPQLSREAQQEKEWDETTDARTEVSHKVAGNRRKHRDHVPYPRFIYQGFPPGC